MAEWTEHEIATLTQLLPDLAAQLRMPLANLHLSYQRLLNTRGVDEDSTEAAIFRHNYYCLLRTVNNLSFAPRLLDTEPFPTTDTDVAQWLDELCRQALPLFEIAHVTLKLQCPERSHLVGIHRGMLERLVWNLLSNALKFTPVGGCVTVSLDYAAGQMVLSVRDTGCGIPEEMMPLVFDRWLHTQRIDPLTHGFGLGLPICRRVAQGHGGRLMLQSQPGEGVCVTVSLPDRRATDIRVEDEKFDYAGGFQHIMLELSDALSAEAYTRRHLDE